MRLRVLLTGAVAAWTMSLWASAADVAAIQKSTTNDAVYTKAQADGAKDKFEKLCAECHAFTVAAKKKPKDKPLGDEPFFAEWNGRKLSELITVIHLTMPNDGSADVSEAEAADLVAYILQQNGFPAGTKPLTMTAAVEVIVQSRK